MRTPTRDRRSWRPALAGLLLLAAACDPPAVDDTDARVDASVADAEIGPDHPDEGPGDSGDSGDSGEAADAGIEADAAAGPDAGAADAAAGPDGGDGQAASAFPFGRDDPFSSLFVVDDDACPPGSFAFPERQLVSDPFVYSRVDWLCDLLGDQVVHLAGDAALAGRDHGCRLLHPAPPEARGLVCLGSGDPPGLQVIREGELLESIRFALAGADGLCPREHLPVTADEARALLANDREGLCALVGPEPTRLAPVDRAALVDCGVTLDHPGEVGQTLCVFGELLEIDGPPILPDVEDRPPILEAEVRALDGAPLGRFFLFFQFGGLGWRAYRTVWAGPADGGPAWYPDGVTSFQLVPTARHMFEPPLGADAINSASGELRQFDIALHVPQYRVEAYSGTALSVIGREARFFGAFQDRLFYTAPEGILDVGTSRAPIRFLVNDDAAPLVLYRAPYASIFR